MFPLLAGYRPGSVIENSTTKRFVWRAERLRGLTRPRMTGPGAGEQTALHPFEGCSDPTVSGEESYAS